MGRCVLSELALNRVCQNLSNESPADVWLDWALCRQCLSGELSRCLSLSISWCLPWSPTIFLPVSVCWVMRSIWAGPRLCLPISSWRGSCWLSVWTELCGVTVSLVSSVGVFHCLLLICLSSCLCWCLSEFNWCLLRFLWRLFVLSVCSSVRLFQGGTCWCLLGLSSRVFNIFLVNSPSSVGSVSHCLSFSVS